MPGYDLRHAIQTSDPQAVMESFKVNIRFILPRIFGYRMCSNCPRCSLTGTPCANKFGNNFEPWGGIAGMAAANSCAVEYQGNNNPHAHGHVHFVSAYQHKTLEEIGNLIKQKLLAPETLYEYQETLHRTCGFVDGTKEERDANRTTMEKAWCTKFRDAEHDALAQLPNVVLDDHTDTLWNKKQDCRAAELDAIEYAARYKQEAEFVMCRTNSHVHLRDSETGKRRPLPGCRAKKDDVFTSLEGKPFSSSPPHPPPPFISELYIHIFYICICACIRILVPPAVYFFLV